jgi:hypothetical protein
MKYLVLALCLAALVPGVAVAASVSDAYIKTEDGYREALDAAAAGKSDEEIADLDRAAVADLAGRLKTMLGEPRPAGFSEGILQPSTLVDGPAAGYDVDGLYYGNDDLTRAFVVTTADLVDHWRRRVGRDYEAASVFNQSLDRLLLSDEFVSNAVAGDQSFTGYADLDLPEARAGGVLRLAVGVSAETMNDMPPPNALVLVRKDRDGRIVAGLARLATVTDEIKACDRQRADWMRADAELASSEAGADFIAYDKAHAAFSACYTGYLAKAPFYAALTDEAKAFAASLGAVK